MDVLLDVSGHMAAVDRISVSGRLHSDRDGQPVELIYDPGDGSKRGESAHGPGRPWTTLDGNGAPTAARAATSIGRCYRGSYHVHTVDPLEDHVDRCTDDSVARSRS